MRRADQEERRRLFRKMEWVFVVAPPVLAVFIAAFGAAFVAWLVQFPGTTFWGRWAVLVAVILGIPLLWHGVRWVLENRR
jgi:hypothetical protein